MPIALDPIRVIDTPTRLIHGPGPRARLAEAVAGLGVRRTMLVTDEGVVAAGIVDRVRGALGDAVLFAEVRPNPDIALVDRLADAVGTPTLADLGFSPDEIPMLARISFEDPQTQGNPRELNVADYEEIWRVSFERGI